MSEILICMRSLYLDRVMGGAGRQSIRLSHRLIEQGQPILILASKTGGFFPHKENVTIDDQTVPVLWVETPAIRGFGTIWYLICVAALFLFNLHRWRVIHVTSITRIMLPVIAIAKLLRRRVVCRILAGDYYLLDRANQTKLPLGRRFQIWGMRASDVVIAQNGEIRAKLISDFNLPEQKVVCIQNGVDTDYYRPADKTPLRQKLDLPPDKTILCYVGRLSPVKRVDVVLDALAALTHRSDVLFLILGDGSEEATLKAQAVRLGLTQQVRFQGFISDPLPYYQASDIFVLPSIVEGHSNALLEAMSCQLAPIASDIGGNNDTIQPDESGLLVLPANPEQLASALDRLLEAPDDRARIARGARQAIIEKYSIGRMTDQYLEVYKQLID